MPKKSIYIYILIYISLFISLIFLYNYIFNFNDDMYSLPRKNSYNLAFNIILNNVKNFLSYIFLFPLMPLFWIIDLISTTWNIYIAINSIGLYNTVDKLFPHIIIELPNYILYSYISYQLMINFYKLKYDMVIKIFFKYTNILLINFFLIIISGFIEGMLS